MLKCIAFIDVLGINSWQFIASQIRYSRSIILPIELPLVSIYILTLPNEGVVDRELVLITEVIDFILQISTNVTMEEILVT